LGLDVNKVAEELMPVMCSYSWPGNVREMENYIERAVIIAKGRMLTPEYFPNKMQVHSRLEQKNDDLTTLANIEKASIEKALIMFKGNISETSRNLGITRNTLYNKIKQYDIEVAQRP
jgi:sigma-54 dependent transcriptional regulator, acetoin dehydrogenase operon transcriptional activator AcoR